ncbi:uncharacterized protein Fot_02966 [Forsythia ovata]|uniref:Uncharacterized protein n=1 Tax=Forsythia ovata TaxID=205694 RepID=A0ABD1X8T1_9LAMI
MNRSFRAPEREQMGTLRLKDNKDEELALFQEMRKREKERNNLLLLQNSDEFDAPLGSRLGSSPIFNITSATPAPVRKTGADDFLNSDGEKNDYEWLLTPPGTPLFPSLEMESQKTVTSQLGTPKVRPAALKSRDSAGQSSSGGPGSRPATPTGRPTLSSTSRSSSTSASDKPTLTTASKPATITSSKVISTTSSKPSRSATPTSRASLPSAKPTVPPRSATPTSRATLPSAKPTVPPRSSTPTTRSTIRSSTPTTRQSLPAPKSTSRAATPTRRTSVSSAPVKSPTSSSVIKPVTSTAKNPVPSVSNSPTMRPRPWKPSDMPGFSLDAPPNLRTSLSDRPASVTRGRPGAPSSRSSSIEPVSNGRVRRQSCSPARGRPPNGITRSSGSSVPVPAVNRLHAKANDNVSPVLIGTKMVERVMNMRKLAPPKQDDKHSPISNLSGKSSSPDSSGFGRTLSKKSLDMAIRHMGIRRTVPGNLRPLMTNIPASSVYSVRSGHTKSRTVSMSDSALATSSASSEVSVNNNALCVDGSEGDDDVSSDKPGVLSRQQHQFSSIPIKKRRFPVFFPTSPSRDKERPSSSDVNDSEKKQEFKTLDQGTPLDADVNTDSLGKSDVENNYTLMVKEEKAANPSRGEERPLGSEFNDSKNKQEYKSPDPGLSLDAVMGSPGKSDVGKNSILMVQKEKVADAKVELAQIISAIETQEAKLGISSGSTNDLGNKVNCLRNENSAGTEVSGSSMDAPVGIVKKEIVSGQVEADCNLELSTGSGNVELLTGPKEPPLLSALVRQNIKEKDKIKLDPSLLSLSLNKENPIPHHDSDSISNNVSKLVSASRTNWDLNTTMDSWEGSVPRDAFLHSTVVTGGFKTSDIRDVKSSSTLDGIVGFSGNRAKHILDECSSNFSNASIQPSQQYNLGLSLAMPYRELDSTREHSSPSGKADSECIGPNSNLRIVIPSTINVNSASYGTVKLEPINENPNTDNTVGPSSSMGLSKFNSVKSELVESCSSGTVLPSSSGPQKLVDQRSTKYELFQEDNKEASESAGAIVSESVGKVLPHQENSASTSVQNLPQNSCPSTLPSFLDSTMNRDLSNQSEHSSHDREFFSSKDVPDELIATVVSNLVSNKFKQSSDHCDKIDNLKVEDSEKCKPVRLDEHPLECCRNEEVAGSDEEKIDISTDMIEEDSFGSDCESGRNHALRSHVDEGKRQREKEDGEYEDGEVREPVVHSTVEDPIVEGKDIEKVNFVDCNTGNAESVGFSCDQKTDMSDFDGKDAAMGNRDETSIEHIKECVDIGSNDLENVDGSLQKSLPYQVREVRVDEKKLISVTAEKPIDSLGREDVAECYEKKVSGESATIGSCGTGTTLGEEATDTNVRKSSPGKHSITLLKADASVLGNNGAKDSNNVGNKSRIINLSRASNATSPSKTRSIPVRLSSRCGKEISSDVEGDKLQRGNRGGFYSDGPKRFTRDRVQDQSFRNSRSNAMLGRGRVSGRFDPLRGERESNRDFASESYNGPPDYWVTRHKHGSSCADGELESNGYDIAPDAAAALRSGRRKTLNDELPSLHHPSLRRRLSPGGREGPATRGIRRIPRNISPGRCNDEDGSDLVGLQHDEKYMRDFSDDIIDPGFSRPQSTYGNMDGRVFRGNRNFYQHRSKSRTQTRPPGSWSSPRRRSPDVLPEMTQYRSPAMYEMGRMRSPDPACFPDEVLPRRRGSPSYIARPPNNLRDVDSGREHIHPRYFNSNRRSSPVQEFPRSTSRDGDEYFTGSVHPGRIHGPRGGGSSEEGRKFGERHGPLRSFRPTYTDDGDNFRFSRVNDGPRSV